MKKTLLFNVDVLVTGSLLAADSSPKDDVNRAPTVVNPKGTVTIWITDGKPAKYAYHFTGTVSFNGNDREVDRTTTTEIKDVNSTKNEVADDAKKPLE